MKDNTQRPHDPITLELPAGEPAAPDVVDAPYTEEELRLLEELGLTP